MIQKNWGSDHMIFEVMWSYNLVFNIGIYIFIGLIRHMCLCTGSYMLTYVISQASFSENAKNAAFFFFVGSLQKGGSQVFLTETMETGYKNRDDFQCMQMSLVMSMPFIFGDDWNDTCKLNTIWHDVIFSKSRPLILV